MTYLNEHITKELYVNPTAERIDERTCESCERNLDGLCLATHSHRQVDGLLSIYEMRRIEPRQGGCGVDAVKHRAKA